MEKGEESRAEERRGDKRKKARQGMVNCVKG